MVISASAKKQFGATVFKSLNLDRGILLLAFIIRLSVLAFIMWSTDFTNLTDSPALNSGDTSDYTLLAENIVEQGVFSSSATAPFTPDLLRTPGYPVFLAVLYLLAGYQHHPLLILGLQLALSLLNVWLVMQIGRKLFTQPISQVAGAIYAFAPATLIYGGLVLTETLFATLLLLTLLLLIQIAERRSPYVWGYAIISGFVYALAVYTRPIGLYAIPIFMLAVFVRLGWNRRALRLALTVLAAFLVGVAPWYYRNYIHYQRLVFTSLANQNLLMYNISSIEAQRQNISWRESKDRLWVEYGQRLIDLNLANPNEAEISQVMGSLAVEHILAHPLEAALYQMVDMLNSFRPGFSMAVLLLREDPSAFGQDVQSGNLEVVATALPHEIFIFTLMVIYYAALYMALVGGGVVLVWRRQWWALVVCGLVAFWFLFQPGSAGNARFRAPVEGLLALIAAVGVTWIVEQVSRRFRRNT